jgi:hypothetical protein
MGLTKQNITFQNTGQTFDFSKNKLGNLTGIYLTPEDAIFTETELQDLDSMFGKMVSAELFPINDVFDVSFTGKAAEYYDSPLDRSFKRYKGKDSYEIKYDLRIDYHHLLRQFESQEMRVIFGIKNRYFLMTKDGDDYKGYKLSDLSLEDIQILTSNLSPLRIELADKSERETEELIYAGYPINQIDRRILSVDVNATSTQLTMQILFGSNPIDNILQADITLTDQTHGVLTYNQFEYLGGVYELSDFLSGVTSVNLTGGCIEIQTEAYIGRQRYIVQAEITVDNFVMMDGNNFVMMDGNNFVFVN